MYERNTLGGSLDIEQTARVMLGLHDTEDSGFLKVENLRDASPSAYLTGARIPGRDYTEFGELENIFD